MTDIAPDTGADAPADGGGGASSDDFSNIDYDALEAESDKWTPEKSKEQIGRLRGEHQKYREKFGPVQKVLASFPAEQQQAVMQALEAIAPQKVGESQDAYRSRVVEAAKWWTGSARNLAGDAWKDIYSEFSPAEKAAVEQAASDAEPGEIPTPGSPEFVKWMQEQIDGGVQKKLDGFTSTQQQERAQAAALQEVQNELESLGYKPNGSDEEQKESEQVCFLAQNYFDGELSAAHDAWTEQKADYARAYIASKRKGTAAPKAGGQPASPEGERPKSGAERMAERVASGYFDDVPSN